MSNAKPLDKLDPLDWIPIDFSAELSNITRTFNLEHASAARIEYNFPSNTPKSETLDQV